MYFFFNKMKNENTMLNYTMLDQAEPRKILCCCCKINKRNCHIFKRFLLIFSLMPLITAIPLDMFEWSRTFYFLVPVSGISTYILLINFPKIAQSAHSRPLYYDDLEDIDYVNTSVRKRFQVIFVFIIQITLTLIMSGLIYYYYDRVKNTNLSRMEIFGVLGGFISLLLKIENGIGKCMLTLLNICKSRETRFNEDVRKLRTSTLEIVTGLS